MAKKITADGLNKNHPFKIEGPIRDGDDDAQILTTEVASLQVNGGILNIISYNSSADYRVEFSQ